MWSVNAVAFLHDLFHDIGQFLFKWERVFKDKPMPPQVNMLVTVGYWGSRGDLS